MEGNFDFRRGLLTTIIGCLALLMLPKASQAAAPSIPGEYVIKVAPGLDMTAARLQKSLGVEQVRPIKNRPELWLVMDANKSRQQALSSLSQSSLVTYAEPNYIYSINAKSMPNDARFGDLWGLHNIGQKDPKGQAGVKGVDIAAHAAWTLTNGSRDVVVAVIDTGIDYRNRDLKENIWVNEKEKNGEPNVDDDGNGYVDDIYGYDFANSDGDPLDDHGHGSHCGGTIGAHGDNEKDVVGVAWQVRMMGIKFLTARGSGSLVGAIESIDYAVKMGADVISASWGGGGFSKALKEALDRAEEKGVLFVAAAGNSSVNADAVPHYPSSYENDNIIAVAAIDNRGSLASFSNYGRTSVDIAAPGVAILSTTPGGLKAWDGTSMATPHVSGVAALLKSIDPSMKASQLKERLLRTARPLFNLRGKTLTGSVVNAYYAVTDQLAPEDPNDPTSWQQKSLSIETEHPYADDADLSWEIEIPGAKKIALYFARFETEQRYDKVEFFNRAGESLGMMTGKHDDSFSPVFQGDFVQVRFTSDSSVSRHGIELTRAHFE